MKVPLYNMIHVLLFLVIRSSTRFYGSRYVWVGFLEKFDLGVISRLSHRKLAAETEFLFVGRWTLITEGLTLPKLSKKRLLKEKERIFCHGFS